jgi:methyl-accepting chemotaxis protein
VLNSKIKSINYNSDLVNQVNEIEGLIADQHRILSADIVGLDTSGSSSFEGKNNDAKARIEKLKGLSNDDKANKILDDLLLQNAKYLKNYKESILPLVDKEKKKEMVGLFQESGKTTDKIIENIKKLEDLKYTQIEVRLNRHIAALSGVNALSEADRNHTEALIKKISETKKLLSDIKISPVELLAKNGNDRLDSMIKIVETNRNEAAILADKAGSSSDEIKKRLEGVKLEGISSDLALLHDLSRLKYWVGRRASFEAEAILTIDENNKSYREALENVDFYLEKISGNTGVDKEIVEQIIKANGEFNDKFGKIAVQIGELKSNHLVKSFLDSGKVIEEDVKYLGNLQDIFRDSFTKDIHRSNQIKNSIILIVGLISFISIFAGMFFAWLVFAKLITPIRNINEILSFAAGGNLSVRAEVRDNGDIGELGNKINSLIDGKKKVIDVVVKTNNELGTLKQKFHEIFVSSKENSGKISQVIKGIIEGIRDPQKEADMSGVEEIAMGAKLVSDESEKVAGNGMKAIEAALASGKAVEEAVSATNSLTQTVRQVESSINRLDEYSEKIGEMTNIISDIASRTNLLALNAAIEAARSGENGKGFTVLAEEIRKLSDGSNKAASDIKVQIKEIQEQVKYAVYHINTGVVDVENSIEKINVVKDNISEVISCMESVVNDVKNTTDIANKFTKNSGDYIKTIGNTLKKGNKSINMGEDINKEVSRQEEMIQEMEAVKKNLSDTTEKLNSILLDFNV